MYSHQKYTAHVRVDPMRLCTFLHIFRETDDGGRMILHTPIAETVGRHGMLDEVKTAFVNPDETEQFLQAVIDAAWTSGYRPAGWQDHESQLTATKYHLEDMRKLAKVTT